MITTTFTKRLAGLFSASVLALGLATVAAPTLAASISSTKHNLGTTGTGSNHQTTGTAEICVFCHTPHAANTTVTAPLWNKGATGSSYTLYSSSTAIMAGTTANSVGSVSLGCLSCHDGTQAMDNMINAPGSGGYTAAGAALAGAVWAGDQTLQNTTIAKLGTDLSNDHPVGMRYCGASALNAAGSNANCTESGWVAPQSVNSKWFIDTTASTGTKNKADFTLYTTAGETQQVECATCHDPHNADTTTFLRISNAGSAVCLACHTK